MYLQYILNQTDVRYELPQYFPTLAVLILNLTV